MPYTLLKNTLLAFSITLLTANCFAQELVQRKNRLTDSVTEVYHTPKDNKYMMQGMYQALYQKKSPVASGLYDKNKRVGTWRFFDEKGRLLETYNYDTKDLAFEAVEDTTSALRYFVDREIKPDDKVTKPIKIGGRYYGYIPYMRLFTLPSNNVNPAYRNYMDAVVELLISPGGRLAYYKVHLRIKGEPVTTINMNPNLPDPADMIFTPATLNGEPISCRIMIRAYITDDNHLDFDN